MTEQIRPEEIIDATDILNSLTQCACAHADAQMCYAIRYNRDTLDLESGEYCYCYCHAEWDATEEDEES